MSFEYPTAKRSDTVETFHDVKIPDPYDWLSEETKQKSECKKKKYFESICFFLKKELNLNY